MCYDIELVIHTKKTQEEELLHTTVRGTTCVYFDYLLNCTELVLYMGMYNKKIKSNVCIN